MKYSHGNAPVKRLLPPHQLAAAFLSRYLFFLSRRPISRSNTFFLRKRLTALKGLAGILETATNPIIRKTLYKVRRLCVDNLDRLVPEIHRELTALTHLALPGDMVQTRRRPDVHFLAPVRRLLLVFGPAIGIGDEIIFLNLPSWLRGILPEVEITVVSGYPDLWRGAPHVDFTRTYTLCNELIEMIRGAGPDGRFDLVMMIDFETPGLAESICTEPNVPRYIELALGARSVVALDCQRRWCHRMEPPLAYPRNFYHTLDLMARWLGMTPDRSVGRALLPDEPRGGRPNGPKGPADEPVVFISPFSSKYDPSKDYWSHLIAALAPTARDAGRMRFVIDPGPNSSTEIFAAELARDVKALSPIGPTCEISRLEGGRNLSLSGVFRQMAESHAVICADSFAAHAAPFLGCTALVLASQGLEAWRVPTGQCYYFDSRTNVAALAVSMRLLLPRTGPMPGDTPRPFSEVAGNRLVNATSRLSTLLNLDGTGCELHALTGAYTDFLTAYYGAVSHLEDCAGEFTALFADRPYNGMAQPLGPIADGSDGGAAGEHMARDLAMHLYSTLSSWENSNLWKYLRRTH